jgi:hypothetical protein
LLVDNAPGHNIKKETKAKLTNVHVHYFRPNLTPILQPCDAGIIKAFKAHYGSLLVDYLIEQIDNGPIESGLIMPNVKQCMQFVNRAWYRVSENSIINCWGKCRILSNFEGSEKLDLKDLIAKIDIKLDLSRFAFNFNAENLLENIDYQDETSEEISVKDIYNLVVETDNTIDDIDEEPVIEQQQEITVKEAKHLLNRLYSFFEQRDNLDKTFLNYLNRIDDKIDDLYIHHKIVQSTLDSYIKQ